MARNIIGHILLIERMLANFMVRKYENWRKPHFSCFSLLILVILLFFITAKLNYIAMKFNIEII